MAHSSKFDVGELVEITPTGVRMFVQSIESDGKRSGYHLVDDLEVTRMSEPVFYYECELTVCKVGAVVSAWHSIAKAGLPGPVKLGVGWVGMAARSKDGRRTVFGNVQLYVKSYNAITDVTELRWHTEYGDVELSYMTHWMETPSAPEAE